MREVDTKMVGTYFKRISLKAVDIARTQEMSNTKLQSMAPEEKKVNSLRETRQRYKYDTIKEI